MVRSMEISQQKVQAIYDKRQNGTLQEEEEASYINQAFNRQEEQANNEDPIQVADVLPVAQILLVSAVDTTASMISWHMLHLAQNPDVQERVRKEIIDAVATTDEGKLTDDIITPTHMPLLFAVIRESHRIRNPTASAPFRKIASEIEVHGVKLPKNCTIMFDTHSQGFDPELLEDPHLFRPERFLPDAVAARKGTKAEMFDHPLFAGPFSQGARRCPASRVARSEGNILIAQLLLDWEFEAVGSSDWRDIPVKMTSLMAPDLPEFKITPRMK